MSNVTQNTFAKFYNVEPANKTNLPSLSNWFIMDFWMDWISPHSLTKQLYSLVCILTYCQSSLWISYGLHNPPGWFPRSSWPADETTVSRMEGYERLMP